jgi:hypothetical protein
MQCRRGIRRATAREIKLLRDAEPPYAALLAAVFAAGTSLLAQVKLEKESARGVGAFLNPRLLGRKPLSGIRGLGSTGRPNVAGELRRQKKKEKSFPKRRNFSEVVCIYT